MRIAVFGVGGVGAYFGGRLAQAGEDVVFIARGDHLQAIQSNGLSVQSPKGDFVVNPAKAANYPEEVGEVDFVRPTVGCSFVVIRKGVLSKWGRMAVSGKP